MRVRPISFLSAISVVALFLVAPSHHGNAVELPQSTQAAPSTVPMDMADATKRIAQLAEGSEYNAAIALAGQMAEAGKAPLRPHQTADAPALYQRGADLPPARHSP